MAQTPTVSPYEPFRFWVEGFNFQRFFSLYGWRVDGKTIDVIRRIEIESVPSEEVRGIASSVNDAMMILNHQEGQNLIDALYQAGFRPSEAVRRETNDIDKHLTDMRKLVSKAYEVEL